MGLWLMGVVPLVACLFSAIQLPEVTCETLKLSTTPIFPVIPRGQTSKDFQVLLQLEAPPAASLKRQVPIDLVIVLDVSGSMNDLATPLENKLSKLDLLKTATKFIIRKLDDADRLSIVAFNQRLVKEHSTGLQHVSCDGRSNAEEKVDRLEANGGTQLISGLEEAVKILDGRLGDSRNRLGFIVLLSDGDDTSGFRWSYSRREIIHGAFSKYPVHTIGLGAAHDPVALLRIAQETQGTYSFVDDEKLGKVAGALAVCLGGMKTIAAVDTFVSLKAAELGGARIDRIDSGGYESRVSCGGDVFQVDVGVLYAGEVKSFVVHLHVPAWSSSLVAPCDECEHHHRRRHEKQQHLLAVGCSYRHAPGATAVSIEGHGVFVERPEVVAAIDSERQLQVPSAVVLQHMARFELLGVVESTIAVGMATVSHVAASSALQSKWEEFRACHQFWGGVDMDVLEQEVDAMARSLTASTTTGVAYVFSWVSSHQMQRATTMGSPADVALLEFLTPAMRTLLEEALQIVTRKKLPATTSKACAGGCHDCQSMDTTTACAGGCHDCQWLDLDVMEQRLELWSKVRREAPLLFQPSTEEDAKAENLAAMFRGESLEAIERAMHRDIYLAVVHARYLKMTRCVHSGAGKACRHAL